MNICVISGNLGADPEIRYSQDGMAVATFSLAFRINGDKNGWVKVACFKKTAELAEKYLHRGAKVAVTGMLDQDKWTTESGENRSSIKLIANGIEFIKTDGRGFDGNSPGPEDETPF